MLSVHIGEFDIDPIGFTRFRGANGAMPAWLGGSGIGEHAKIVRIKDGFIEWSDGLRFPTAPMLGFVGVAPEYERYTHSWAGYWGGNMDVQEVTTGCTVQLPVYVPGALLHVGDMHARQGDGEICGAGGIESSARVRLRCEAQAKPVAMSGPRLENATHIMTRRLCPPGGGRLPRCAGSDDLVAGRELRVRPRRSVSVPRAGARSARDGVRQPDVLLHRQSPQAVPPAAGVVVGPGVRRGH